MSAENIENMTWHKHDINLLNNCLFGSAKLTKNADLDKCEYTGYSIGFDSRSEYLFTDRSMGKSHYLWSWSELTCICPYWLKK